MSATAIEQVKKTNIVSISITSPKPETAAAVANALADVYVLRTLELNRRATEQALQYVGEQVSVSQGELDEAESAMRRYKERTGLMETDTATGGQVAKVTVLQEEVRKLGVELKATSAEIRQVDGQRRAAHPTVLSEREQRANPAVQSLKDKLLGLEVQRLQLLDEYSPASRKIKQLDDQIGAIKQRLTQEVERVVTGETEAANPVVEQLDKQKTTLESQRIANQARLAALAAVLPAERARLSALPAQQVEFSRLSRRVKVAETAYVNLLTRQQELLIARGSEVANAAIVSIAGVPREPTGPGLAQNLAVAAALGLLLGLVLAVLVDYLDDSIKNPREAEALLGVPAIGLISYAADNAPLLISDPTSRSPLAEAFRALRSNLRFSAADQTLQTLLITSPGVGEGKSTISVDVAVAAANAGQRVILVDTDLRRPSLHRLFDLENAIGLTSVLVGDLPLDQALIHMPANGIFLLTSGPLPPNPIELLESEAMERAIAGLRERADLVIFDSPPLLVVADSQILSSKVDGTLLVLEMKGTRREMAKQAKELLTRAGARLLGLVANKLRRMPGGYYYYYYDYYYYGSDERKGKGTGSAR